MLHGLAVFKLGRVPIELDGRAFVVGHHCRVDATQSETFELAHRIKVAVGIVGIETEECLVGARLDVLGHLEGNGEFSRAHGNLPMEKHILMVIHRLGRARTWHDDLRLLVEKPHPQIAVELAVDASVDAPDLSLQSHHAHGVE